jgi:hypothetical protein
MANLVADWVSRRRLAWSASHFCNRCSYVKSLVSRLAPADASPRPPQSSRGLQRGRLHPGVAVGKAVSEKPLCARRDVCQATGRNGLGTDGHPATHEVAEFEPILDMERDLSRLQG